MDVCERPPGRRQQWWRGRRVERTAATPAGRARLCQTRPFAGRGVRALAPLECRIGLQCRARAQQRVRVRRPRQRHGRRRRQRVERGRPAALQGGPLRHRLSRPTLARALPAHASQVNESFVEFIRIYSNIQIKKSEKKVKANVNC